MMELRFIGGCLPLFFVALAFDALGIILLFLGIFADLKLNGIFYGDFLIYTGSVILFSSLGLWMMWYVGNIKVPAEGTRKGRAGTAHSFKQLARKLTERISRRQEKEDEQSVIKSSGGGGGGGGEEEDGPKPGRSAQLKHKGSKVTWGKATCYHNQAYEKDSQENISMEEKSSSDLQFVSSEKVL